MSNKYAYQIKGLLEKENKDIGGLRVMVCTADFFDIVDVPADIFDSELLRFLKFRLAVNDYLDVRKLPYTIQNDMRAPLNVWLDNWVLKEKIIGNSK
jgi:hypothetical protein